MFVISIITFVKYYNDAAQKAQIKEQIVSNPDKFIQDFREELTEINTTDTKSKLNVKAHAFSKTAQEAIESKQGTAEKI